MRRAAAVALTLAGFACAQAGSTAGASGPAPSSDDEKTLYALGAIMAQNTNSFDLKPEERAFVLRGFADALEKKPLLLQTTEFGPKVGELAQKRAMARVAPEKEKGKAYAEEAAKESGAEKTASGLVYASTAGGKGETPKATDTVSVHYTGTLIDGTVFDSSRERNQPAEFALNGVIPCWTEGLQKMKPGGRAKLVCPSDIAYGDRGRPPKIPGGATLVFDVELLSVSAGRPGAGTH